MIGSGPSGLTVAYYLRLKGYQVTIFEALEVLGGMLRVGIPDYRLPPEVLDQEIDHILRLGVKTRTGVRFGIDLTFEDLKKEGFAAVFLGIGAHNSLDMQIPGEKDTQGVIDAVRFLREVNLGNKTCPGSRVVVIGGGNVAIDAARVVKRLGSQEVTVVYRRSEQEMPAYAEEIEGAKKEEIRFSFLTAPVGILAKKGKVDGFECIRTELGPPDDSGRRRPVPVDGSEFVIPCDAVIPAIGQKIDTSWAVRDAGLEMVSTKHTECKSPNNANRYTLCFCRRRCGHRPGHRNTGGGCGSQGCRSNPSLYQWRGPGTLYAAARGPGKTGHVIGKKFRKGFPKKPGPIQSIWTPK